MLKRIQAVKFYVIRRKLYFVCCFVAMVMICARLFAASPLDRKFRSPANLASDTTRGHANIGDSHNFFVRNESGFMSTNFVLSVPPEIRGPFTVKTITGEPGSPRRISQATIWINDIKIIQTSDFDNGVSNPEASVKQLNTDNVVRIELIGPVNSFLWVHFRGFSEIGYRTVFNESFQLSKVATTIKTFSSHPDATAPYELIVKLPWVNGKHFSSPARIVLNGNNILDTFDFEQNNSSLIRRQIDLLAENSLEVENLEVTPRNALGILIRGRNAPPRIRKPRESDSQRLRELRTSIDNEIGTPTANETTQCKLIAFGSKPCGGPASYLVYSAARTDEAKLKELVDEFNQLSRKINQELKIMSDCMFVTEPVVEVIGGMCTTKPR